MRIGIGYDIHGLKKGRKLILGGVPIPSAKGLTGHSDGDALSHAIVDALLGAAGEGDIGDHFPDSDEKYRGAASSLFIRRVRQLLQKRKLKISNVDAVVVAETPRLAPYKNAMKNALARALGVRPTQIGLKAKTNEGFGPIGKGQAIACFAVASLRG